jgi:hypothetical protein
MASPTTAHKHLATYLNDHLGGSTAGLELARRIGSETRGTEAGAVMDGVATDIAEDRRTLEELMASFGVTADPVKQAVAWVSLQAGRLKLNPMLLGPALSRFEELEALSVGVEGKRLMWVAFADCDVGDRIGQVKLAELIARAESQRARVEKLRVESGRAAFDGAV